MPKQYVMFSTQCFPQNFRSWTWGPWNHYFNHLVEDENRSGFYQLCHINDRPRCLCDVAVVWWKYRRQVTGELNETLCVAALVEHESVQHLHCATKCFTVAIHSPIHSHTHTLMGGAAMRGAASPVGSNFKIVLPKGTTMGQDLNRQPLGHWKPVLPPELKLPGNEKQKKIETGRKLYPLWLDSYP